MQYITDLAHPDHHLHLHRRPVLREAQHDLASVDAATNCTCYIFMYISQAPLLPTIIPASYLPFRASLFFPHLPSRCLINNHKFPHILLFMNYVGQHVLQCCGAGSGLFGPFGARVVLKFLLRLLQSEVFFCKFLYFFINIIASCIPLSKTFQKTVNIYCFLYFGNSLLPVSSDTQNKN